MNNNVLTKCFSSHKFIVNGLTFYGFLLDLHG